MANTRKNGYTDDEKQMGDIETMGWIKNKLDDTYIHISDDYKKCNFENPWVKN